MQQVFFLQTTDSFIVQKKEKEDKSELCVYRLLHIYIHMLEVHHLIKYNCISTSCKIVWSYDGNLE